MKKSLLAIALGLAVMPLTFAQTAPTNPPAKETSKKSKKSAKSKKAPKKTEGAGAGQSK